jgi:alpha-ribazole phosphatase
MRIALVRHTAPAVPGVCYGRLEVALAASAAADIAGVLERLGDIGRAAVWTSPAARCRALAEAIAVRAHGDPIADPRLQELDFGDWEGRSWEAVPRADLDRWAADPLRFAPPRGESGAALIGRVTAFHHDLRDRAGEHVVVAHGGPLKILAALAQGRPIDLLAPPLPFGGVLVIRAESICHGARRG